MKRRYFAAVVSASSITVGLAQTVIDSQSFEDDGATGIGYTIDREFSDGDTDNDYFTEIENIQANYWSPVVPPNNADGSYVLGAEDMDNGNNPTSGLGARGHVTLNAVNTSGMTNLSLKVLLAAPGHFAPPDTSRGYDYHVDDGTRDELVVQVSYDGGPFQNLASYQPDNSIPGGADPFSSFLSLDTNGDNRGDAGNAAHANALGKDFKEFTYNLNNAGNVAVRFMLSTNSSREYILIDNVRILGESAATNPPVLSGVPGTALNYGEGDPATVIAPAISVVDSDSSNLSSATVTITQGYSASEDVLAATASGAIGAGDIAFNAGVLTITANASLADYQAVLQSVTYQNTNAVTPDTTQRRVQLSANDGSNDSNAPIRDTLIMEVVPVQSIPYTESFETDGAGTRYGVLGRFMNGNEIFDRVDVSGRPELTGVDGSFAFEAEETDQNAAPIDAVEIPVDTSTKHQVKLDILLSAPSGSTYDIGDALIIETSVGSDPFQELASFHATGGGVGKTLSQDTTGDGMGDGAVVLTTAFQNFQFDLPSVADLVIRIHAMTNVGGEQILFDNIRIDGLVSEFSIADNSAVESNGSISFTITRSDTTGAASVDYATSSGTATSGSDFTATSDTANFADGVATAMVSVSIQSDSDVEQDEKFTVTLSNPSNGFLAADDDAEGTILNDDFATLGMNPNIPGKIAISDLETLSGGSSFVSAVTGSTGNGGTVMVQDGYLFYVPAAWFEGSDTVSYTLANGTYTLHVTVGQDTKETFNIRSVTPSGNTADIVAFGIPGRVYRLQTSSDMASWSDLGGDLFSPPSGQLNFSDPGPLPPTRFYRVIEVNAAP
ncbi:hypothetical protein N9042_00455 [bacterium]|nr:hypothetical protein [Akkermansiaceae bacterium]MDB4488218.1 hypothetical protein [bacterium]MDB4541904.1 hypothetical protein [bacterium]